MFYGILKRNCFFHGTQSVLAIYYSRKFFFNNFQIPSWLGYASFNTFLFFSKHDYWTLQDQNTICILFPNTNLGYIDVYLNDLTYSIFTILLLFFSFVFSPLHPVALIALFLTICIIHQLLMWFFFSYCSLWF